jgi:hypothetical protein
MEMKRDAGHWAVGSAGLVLAGLLVAGGAAAGAPEAALDQDARLQTKVTLGWKDRPLGEALAALGQEIHVPLRASRDTADDGVTLFVAQRPATEVMGLLARHFEFQWYRRGEGYELGQSAEARQREAALRRQDLEAQLASLAVALERRPRMAATPRRTLEEREREIAQSLNSQGLEEWERARLEEERSAIMEALHPGRAVAAAVFRSLSPPQMEQLLAGRDLWLSGADGTLSPSLARQVEAAEGEAARLAAWQPFFQLLGQERWPPAEPEVVVRLCDTLLGIDGPPPRGEPHLMLEFLVPFGKEEGRRRWAIAGWTVEGKQQPPALPAPAVETDDPDLKRPVDLTPLLERMRRPNAMPAEAGEKPDAAWPAGMVRVSDLAEALHRSTGLEVLADSFVRARLDPGVLAAPRGTRLPVSRVLGQIADGLDYTWRKEGNLLLLRDRCYYRDRVEEVPEAILRPWRERVRRNHGASLDDLAALAAAVNDAQARGLHQYWGWCLADTPGVPASMGPGRFLGCLPHLRFWAGLSPGQRRAALRGGYLPVSRLGLPQRQAFVAALLSQQACSALPDDLQRPPTAAEVSAGGFRLRAPAPPETTGYTFAYHLAGEPTAAREIEIRVLGVGH